MPRVETSAVIPAPRDRVIEIMRNNEAFPDFMLDVASVKVIEKSDDGLRIVSNWVGIVPKFGAKVKWTEEDIWDLEAGTCTFRQIKGDYDHFEGCWTFTTVGGETRFDSWIDYSLEIPLVGPLIKSIIHKTMQNNVESTARAVAQRCLNM